MTNILAVSPILRCPPTVQKYTIYREHWVGAGEANTN